MEIQSKNELRDNIHKLLGIYENYIESQNSSGLFDINRDCEHIFCEFLNVLYDWDLCNLNDSLKLNYPAIDLEDINNNIFIQVTSQNKAKKILETIMLFQKSYITNNYSELWFLILGKKKNYKLQFPDYVTIIDFSDLSKAVAQCHQKNTLLELQNVLHDELGMLNLIDVNSRNSLLKNINDQHLNLGKCYNSLFTYCGFEKDATQKDVDDINQFANELHNLNFELREVLYAGCIKRLTENRYSSFIDNVRFNATMVATYLGDKKEVYNRYRQLMQLGYLRDDEDDVLYFTFYNRSKDYDILKTVVDFCDAKQLDLKPILLDLNLISLD